MRVQTIQFMQRTNLGNYEHMELTANAVIEEGEQELTAILALRTLVETALKAKVKETLEGVEIPPKIPEEKTKKKTKAAKPAEESVLTPAEPTSEVEKEEVKIKVEAIPYDRENEQHRSILISHLRNTFPDWSKKDGVKEFTTSLPGKDFLDKATGEVVESFLEKLRGFFA